MLKNQASQLGLQLAPFTSTGNPIMLRHLTIPLLVLAVSPLLAADKSEKKVAKPGKATAVKVKDITLSVPSTWKQEKPTSRLRAGQFKLPAVAGDKEGAELVVYFFGGAGGGADANIRRWIGQFQSEGRKMKVLQGKSTQGPYLVLDLSGTYNKPIGPPIQRRTKPMPGARMLAVILSIKDKGNYFLKLTGPNKTVTAAASQLRVSFGADPKKETPYEANSKKGEQEK